MHNLRHLFSYFFLENWSRPYGIKDFVLGTTTAIVLIVSLVTCSNTEKTGPDLDPSIKPVLVTLKWKDWSGTKMVQDDIYPFKAVDIGRDTNSFDSHLFVPVSKTFTDTLSISFMFFNPYQEDTMDVIAVRNEEGRPWVYWEARHFIAAYHAEGPAIERLIQYR